MIERAAFVRAWARLEERWGETAGADAYYAYLSERMDTEAFLRAAAAVWATREFFPRPADFLLVDAGGDWRAVSDAIAEHSPPTRSGWHVLGGASERARAAVRAMGGLPVVVEAYRRDPLRARREWSELYELAVVEDATALPPESEVPQVEGKTAAMIQRLADAKGVA